MSEIILSDNKEDVLDENDFSDEESTSSILSDEDDEEGEDNDEEDNDEEGEDDLSETSENETANLTHPSNLSMDILGGGGYVDEVETYEDDDDDDDDYNSKYLQKFDEEINKQYIKETHSECISYNYNEVSALVNITRDPHNNIIDDLHKTIPILTKYERSRILGMRTKQLDEGASPYIIVPSNIIDGYIIAEMELTNKKIPYIIRRPIPGGGSEYWRLKDLEVVL